MLRDNVNGRYRLLRCDGQSHLRHDTVSMTELFCFCFHRIPHTFFSPLMLVYSVDSKRRCQLNLANFLPQKSPDFRRLNGLTNIYQHVLIHLQHRIFKQVSTEWGTDLTRARSLLQRFTGENHVPDVRNDLSPTINSRHHNTVEFHIICFITLQILSSRHSNHKLSSGQNRISFLIHCSDGRPLFSQG